MTLEIGLLGSVEAKAQGELLNLGGPRQRRLLAYLALSRGLVRAPDGLVEAVWPDGAAPPEPRQAIQTYVSRLRSIIGPDVIVTRNGGYALTIEGTDLDIERFERLVRAAADPGCPQERAVATWSEALGVWRGRAIEEFATEEWARGDAARLEELRANAIDERAAALLALGSPADAVADLEAAAAASPLRERTHVLLMCALHRSGRQAEALRVFQRYRRRLATDLGLEPGSEIRRLESEIAATGEESQPIEGRLRGYVLGERIGDGAFAVVHRGSQPGVGRDVAIKVVRASLANRPEFIRRFEAEAHLVARLEHPHIVPLYDYWREPGSACLVMRLLRGGTLEQRIGDHPLTTHEAVRLVNQVGAALSVAHRAGVVHRDVKSANVLLDEEGNFFLGDFGIAYEAAAPQQAVDSLSVGSPAYASPEQLRREPVGPPADVHGLAITMYEALTGALPFPAARTQAELLRSQLLEPLPPVTKARPDLQPAVDVVLRRATAKDPADRYPTAAEFADALALALTGTPALARVGAATAVGEIRNPYKGLRAFQEADVVDFHGRQRLVDRLIQKLAGPMPAARFLTVVGPSGSGKSSVVRAGLMPAIRGGAIPGSRGWFVTSMVPGAHPFEELEAALNRIAVAPTAGLAELMATDRRGVARAVKQACPVENAEVVLLIDQFEELFTLCEDDTVRQQFISGLVAAVTDPRSRLRVVATLRADFFDRPLRYPEIAEFIDQGAITVAPLAADELDRAITEPAARVGATFEPGLVARIVADVVDQPGALPLLQYALTELFDRSTSGLMTVSAYEDLGGLSGALARRAEQEYDGASPAQREAIRRVVTRLVTLGEGTEDTRRRVKRSEFGADEDTAGVIDLYGAARLLAFDRDPATREPTVEVAHEALIREWPRLKAWLDDDRDGLRLHRHLTTAATAWSAAGRDAGELYRGARLEAVEHWVEVHSADLNPVETEFVATSIDQRRRTKAAEHRAKRRLQRALVAAAVVAVMALIAGGLAWQQQHSAVEAKGRAQASALEAERARSNADASAADAVAQKGTAEAQQRLAEDATKRSQLTRLASQSLASRGSQRDLAALLAVQSWKLSPDAASKSALFGTFTFDRGFLGFLPIEGASSLDGVAIPGTTNALVTAYPLDFASSPSTVVVDIVTGAEKARMAPLFTGGVLGMSLAVSGDGRLGAEMAVPADPNEPSWRVGVFDLATGAVIASPIDVPVEWGTVALDRSGAHLAVADGIHGDVAVYDVASGRKLASIPGLAGAPISEHGRDGGAIAYGPDGRLYVGSRGDRLRVFDPDTFASVAEFPVPLYATGGVFRFSPDGSVLLARGIFEHDDGQDPGQEGAVARIDLPSGHVAWEITPEEFGFGDCASLAMSFETDRLWCGNYFGLVRERSLSTGARTGSTFENQKGWIQSLDVVDVDGRDVLVSFGNNYGAIGRWGVDGNGLIQHAVADDRLFVAYAGESAQLLVGTPNGKGFPFDLDYAIWDSTTDHEVVTLPEIAYADSRGDLLFGGFTDGTAGWENVTTKERRSYAFDGDEIPNYIDISVDGRLALSGFDAGEIKVTETASGAILPVIHVKNPDGSARNVDTAVFSADGRRVYTSGGGLWAFDTATGQQVAYNDDGFILNVAASPAGVLVAAKVDGTLGIFDPDSLAELASLPGARGFIGQLVFSADGSLLLAAGNDGTVSIYDMISRVRLGDPVQVGDNDAVYVRLRADGLEASIGYPDRETGAVLWDLDPEHWVTAACAIAGRNLTREEWATYIGDLAEYQATCPEFPLLD